MIQQLIDIPVFVWQTILATVARIELLSVNSFDPSPATTVHVVGSGASAVESLVAVNDDEPKITANLSCALQGNWDIVFIEYDKDQAFFLAQANALSQTNIKRIILKNNYPFTSTKRFDYYRSLRAEQLHILLESPFVGHYTSFVKDPQWYGKNPIMAHQYASSLFIMIQTALRFFPSQIVLHGIDFGGPSFYHLPSYRKFDPGIINHINKRGRVAASNVKDILFKLIPILEYNHNTKFRFGVDLLH
jgi:hypothetical protein